MKKRKSVIIIGGGIAGLAAGCYAQMNGYHSQIFEMHYVDAEANAASPTRSVQ